MYYLSNRPSVRPSIHSSIYLSMALQSFCWTFASISVSLSYTQSVGLLGRGISPSQGHYLYTEHTHRINAHTDIHALCGIRTHDPSVQASEDSSCLRPRGHCDRQINVLAVPIQRQRHAHAFKKKTPLFIQPAHSVMKVSVSLILVNTDIIQPSNYVETISKYSLWGKNLKQA
jgi:hypothetical protein